MSKRHEINDDEYHSQPTPKSSKWIHPKWRPTKKTGEGSSVRQEAVEEVVVEEKRNPPKWVFPNKNSDKWSESVYSFYNNGDAHFCYSKFLDDTKLDGRFWGALLGYQENGELSGKHIEAWVYRIMRLRQGKVKKNGPSGYRWSIVPPQFKDEIYDKAENNVARYANGSDELFPPFWEVVYVYLPVYVSAVNEWLLCRIDMRTLEMVQFWTNHRYLEEYSSLLFNSELFDVMGTCFTALLTSIRFWRRYNGPYRYPSEKIMKFTSNLDYLPKYSTSLGSDSGVAACLLMDKLVEGKTLNGGDDLKDTCAAYRRHMTEQIYRCRFEP